MMARMGSAYACISVILVFSQLALGQRNTPLQPLECPGAADSSCNAFSALEILTTGGRCHGTASADCTAVSVSENHFRDAFDQWFSDPDSMCDSGKAEATATAVATAIAEVWTNAATKVTCEGMGFACGWSISNGNTFALAFAESIASAAAEAGDGVIADAFCFADVRAVSSALATAAARANSDICTTGGTAEDYAESYVQAVQVAIANAFARATASACVRGQEVSAASECSGEAESTGEGSVIQEGDICAGTQQLKPCTGATNTECCSSGFTRSLCLCRNCKGPWIKRSSNGTPHKSFRNTRGDVCFCLDTPDNGEETDGEQELPETTIEPEAPAAVDTTGSAAVDTESGSGTETSPQAQAPSPDADADSEKEEAPETEPLPEADNTTSPAPGPVPSPDASPAADKTEEGQIFGRDATVTCPGAVDTSCSAFASLEISTSFGRCTGKAGADCTAVNDSQSEFTEAFEEWYGDEGMCDSGKAEVAAIAVSKAVAQVWANAALKVSCEGVGFACGWSISDGQTWAIGFAEAIAQAAAEVGSGASEGFCFADVRAISVVIAEAASRAQTDACTTGQTVTQFQDSYANAIAVGIATAFARATASACSEDGELAASSECVGEGVSDLEGDKFAAGDACAGIERVKECTGAVKEMCCDKSFTRNICSCGRQGCSNSPWIKRSDFDYENGKFRSFQDRARNTCFCLE